MQGCCNKCCGAVCRTSPWTQALCWGKSINQVLKENNMFMANNCCLLSRPILFLVAMIGLIISAVVMLLGGAMLSKFCSYVQ